MVLLFLFAHLALSVCLCTHVTIIAGVLALEKTNGPQDNKTTLFHLHPPFAPSLVLFFPSILCFLLYFSLIILPPTLHQLTDLISLQSVQNSSRLHVLVVVNQHNTTTYVIILWDVIQCFVFVFFRPYVAPYYKKTILSAFIISTTIQLSSLLVARIFAKDHKVPLDRLLYVLVLWLNDHFCVQLEQQTVTVQ